MRGIAIYPEHRLNRIENGRSKQQPLKLGNVPVKLTGGGGVRVGIQKESGNTS